MLSSIEITSQSHQWQEKSLNGGLVPNGISLRLEFMEFFSHFPEIGALIIVFSWLWWMTKKSKITLKLPPEPSGALPIIGHLHLLGGKVPLARTLAAMAVKYGPIFTIRLGTHRALVISSQEAIKECLSANDRIFASRPTSSQGKYLGFNNAAFGFAPYGKYWRSQRKIATIELLSARRLDSLKHVRIAEVESMIRDLHSLCAATNRPTKVPIGEWIEQLTLNIITRVIAGKKYVYNSGGEIDEEAQRINKIIKTFMFVSGVPIASDLIPVIGHVLDYFAGQLKTMKRCANELGSVVESWIEEHTVKAKADPSRSDCHERGYFIDIMLSVIEDNETLFGHTREAVIKGMVSTVMAAASDTTAITMIWALSLLLNNKHVLRRAQAEMDSIVGKGRWVEDDDIKDLIYLQAIVKESLRLYPPAPLSVPHEATEDCQVCGYHVPKGTRLFTNLWKLHRDPTVWANPDEFSPGRFMERGEDYESSGHNYEFLPFGSGRRSCPGMTLALQVLHLLLARLIQGFEMESEIGVDMSEGSGITLPKITPLELLLTPRLPSSLYTVPGDHGGSTRVSGN